MKITHIRPVLLSAPYAKPVENLEVELHLKSGYRTTGLVELTLEDGTTGLGEAYLAVFAPKVFTEIVNLITPYVIGLHVLDIPSVM
jgi:L-alanine-DL-glutamate epimerase-like enolase superfamily enzyme